MMMYATLAGERICQHRATEENKINKETPLGRKVAERIFAVFQVGTHTRLFMISFIRVSSAVATAEIACIVFPVRRRLLAVPCRNAETEIISRFVWIFV